MNPSTAAARVLVDELVRLGLRHLVLCPGSRSAPLAYAALGAARRGDLEVHVRVDERSAAFLAVGLAKATGVPAAVVTTSGTAVANLHPAVAEADEAGVPLLLLTADRPPELRGTRANQTTRQVGFFCPAVRWEHDLDTPGPGEVQPAQAVAWRTAAGRAWAAASGHPSGDPGPAHLNVPLRDPLAPEAGEAGEFGLPAALAGRAGAAPWVTALPAAPPSAPTVTDRARTLVVLGDLSEEQAGVALAVARRHGWPVVGEPFGPGARAEVLPHGPLFAHLPEAVRGEPPERIVVVGRPTLTRTLAAVLRTPGMLVEVVTTRPLWPDAGHVAARVHAWAGWAALLTSPPPSRTEEDRAWLASWRRAAEALRRAVAPTLRASWPSGPALAATVLAALPEQARLFVGSSGAARDVDLARGGRGPAVVASRGLAGIDGCVSTAAGMALADARPTYALLGDLTFLHDANGLLRGPSEREPDVTIVVADDQGGAIFGALEYGEPQRVAADEEQFERLFATPTLSRPAAVAAGHGVPVEVASTPEEVTRALAPPEGTRVVVVPLPRHRRRVVEEGLVLAASGAE